MKFQPIISISKDVSESLRELLSPLDYDIIAYIICEVKYMGNLVLFNILRIDQGIHQEDDDDESILPPKCGEHEICVKFDFFYNMPSESELEYDITDNNDDDHFFHMRCYGWFDSEYRLVLNFELFTPKISISINKTCRNTEVVNGNADVPRAKITGVEEKVSAVFYGVKNSRDMVSLILVYSLSRKFPNKVINARIHDSCFDIKAVLLDGFRKDSCFLYVSNSRSYSNFGIIPVSSELGTSQINAINSILQTNINDITKIQTHIANIQNAISMTISQVVNSKLDMFKFEPKDVSIENLKGRPGQSNLFLVETDPDDEVRSKNRLIVEMSNPNVDFKNNPLEDENDVNNESDSSLTSMKGTGNVGTGNNVQKSQSYTQSTDSKRQNGITDNNFMSESSYYSGDKKQLKMNAIKEATIKLEAPRQPEASSDNKSYGSHLGDESTMNVEMSVETKYLLSLLDLEK